MKGNDISKILNNKVTAYTSIQTNTEKMHPVSFPPSSH